MAYEKEFQLIKDKIRYTEDFSAFVTEVIGIEYKDFHREWVESFEKNRFNLILAPRNHGKTWMVASYIIWNIVKNPDIKVLIITINQDMANGMMRFVQGNLEGNQKLIDVFGPQKSYILWSRDALIVKGASDKKNPTLKVLGITASMVGSHCNIIVLDDITDKENSRTPTRRNNLVFQFKNEIMPMLDPGGKVLVIGTRWNESDIYSYIMNKISDYKVKKYKAILNEEEIKNGDSPKVLWFERFPYEELEKIKKRYGSVAFQMQYQNEIISLADSPIKREWIEASLEAYLNEYKRVVNSGGTIQTYMGVDFASKGEESDYFVITIIGVHGGKIFVLDGLRTKASLFRQFDLIKSYDNKWQPIKIGVESVAQQKIITDQLMDMTTLPIIPIKSSKINDKMIRVQRLSVLFETGRVFLNPKEELMVWGDEMAAFPRGANDDTIDSLAFAIQTSQSEEKQEGIDWNLASDMIVARKSDVRNVGRNYEFIKVGR